VLVRDTVIRDIIRERNTAILRDRETDARAIYKSEIEFTLHFRACYEQAAHQGMKDESGERYLNLYHT